MARADNAQPALRNAFLMSTMDALMVFEAARRGICPVVTRRLHDTEKSSIIVSGAVFAFDEQSTGIKRCESTLDIVLWNAILSSWGHAMAEYYFNSLHRDRWSALEPLADHRQLPGIPR